MITSPSLKKGMLVGILSTARKISHEEIDPALKIIESWGLRVKIGKTIGAEHNQFAGSDQLRVNDLQEMLDDPEIKAIFCARGGYGTVRLLEKIDFRHFISHPKWIAGYSDITALHIHVNQQFGIESLHSTMPVNFSSNSIEALESFRLALFGEKLEYSIPAHPFNQIGSINSRISGGNLSIICSLNGSKDQIDPTGRILFIEDLDEYLYHIDRMMMSLKRSDVFNKIDGIIIGSMSDMNDNEIPFGKTAEEIIFDYTKDLGIPVCFGFPAGHLNDNRCIILGRQLQFQVGESESTLIFETA